jgi:hypothetical protein
VPRVRGLRAGVLDELARGLDAPVMITSAPEALLSMALNQLLDRSFRKTSGGIRKLGISPAELSDLRHYRLRAFPIVRMLSIFVALGYDVDVVVRQQGSGRVTVVSEFWQARTSSAA